MLKVALVTATKGRHEQLERLVRFVLDQTYSNYVHIIFNNSQSLLRLAKDLDPSKFILINQSKNTDTDQPYTNLGQIYNDAIKFIPEDIDLVNFADDDDIFLPNHVDEGVKGYIKGQKKAYKPQRSWYKHLKNTHLVENVLEPSIFVEKNHILEHGFSEETTAQHHKWLNPLIHNKEIYVDPDGIPTYVCDWSQEIGTFKTSGNPHNPDNFKNYESHSKDNGDGIITPCSQSWAKHYCRIKPTT